jgi:hypothetical protein
MLVGSESWEVNVRNVKSATWNFQKKGIKKRRGKLREREIESSQSAREKGDTPSKYEEAS